ncbi:dehydrogenase [Dyadobacter luteus]|uniref:Dehydrogenase n=1 Tax=Dyadobacter luteus TaxID=2259619 RepID=A0A3D8YC30_9BACT|nr:c-type cytochrome [Dyadobacter luteus]REA59743.1 dehydrogenase [Dyadobacter luteus]
MKKYQYPFLIVGFSTLLIYCTANKQSGSGQNTSVVKTEEVKPIDFSKSPFVAPEATISKMVVEDGFEVKLVAAEPLVSAPVAMLFDDKARMWVVEMIGYMPDTIGTGEDIPNGKIVILEDKNKDGVYDDRKVFLDSLVLPRAICLIDNGILVAEPTNLWFYEIQGDKPVKKTLVDDQYAVGGNVEHQPNGLLRAMDNWIYNAKSDKRYRKIKDKWVVEHTHFRGQWGITQDNYGRVYYNNNSQNLLGDYFSPGFGASNKNQRGVAGYNEKSVANNKVYPIRPTPGVNRGYMKNVLDDSLRLNEFTAAAAPVIYRGDLFGKEYEWNAFVPEPSANLIKRNILKESGYVTKGEQAYKGKEFLASTDERFRPVTLTNAPDGSMYILDMYRGIIQHKTYLTPYLKDQIGKRELTQPLASGRIYKVVPKNKKTENVILQNNPEQLVKLLGHANGWVRDKAQQKLIDTKSTQAIPLLRSAIEQKENPLFALHALWTLEGLEALKTEEVLAFINNAAWVYKMQGLTAVPAVISKDNYARFSNALDLLIASGDTLAAPYVAFLAPSIKPFDSAASTNLLKKLALAYPDNRYVADAIVSNLQDEEEPFLTSLTSSFKTKDPMVAKQLQKAIANAKSAAANRNPEILKKQFPKGEALFTSICQTCHGIDGNGVKSLGPPLNQSEWVTGSREKLISIVLFGLTGPVKVNGHVYQAPEISGDMPGIGYDPDMQSEDIAQLLSYIRKSWRNNSDQVSTDEVARVRKKLTGRQKAFTEAELNGI